MANPIDRALTTPEVLEAILFRLPLRDLLVQAQQVNHAWNDLISLSPALQGALFFRPQKLDHTQPITGTFNPLLQMAFPAWFRGFRSVSRGRPSWSNHEAFVELDWISSEKKQVAYARSEASWRRMLPVQPAARNLEIVRRWSGRDPASEQRGRLHFENGIRMGILYDLVQEHLWILHFGLCWEMVPAAELVDHDDDNEADEDDDDMPSDQDDIVDRNQKTNLKSTSLPFQPRDCVVIKFKTYLACILSAHNKIDLTFKSLGYEKVDVEFGSVVRNR